MSNDVVLEKNGNKKDTVKIEISRTSNKKRGIEKLTLTGQAGQRKAVHNQPNEIESIVGRIGISTDKKNTYFIKNYKRQEIVEIHDRPHHELKHIEEKEDD